MKINLFTEDDKRLFTCYNCDNSGVLSIDVDISKEIVLCKSCAIKLIKLLIDNI